MGLENSGKTTFLEEMKSEYIQNYTKPPKERIQPTVGQNMATIKVDHTYIKFWDVGGQATLKEAWDEYYGKSHAMIIMVDSCDKKSLQKCIEELKEIKTNDSVEGLPILMLANKQDSGSGEDKMDLLEIKESLIPIADSLNAREATVLPVSGETGEGVKEAVEWLKTRMIRNKMNKAPKYRKHRKKRH